MQYATHGPVTLAAPAALAQGIGYTAAPGYSVGVAQTAQPVASYSTNVASAGYQVPSYTTAIPNVPGAVYAPTLAAAPVATPCYPAQTTLSPVRGHAAMAPNVAQTVLSPAFSYAPPQSYTYQVAPGSGAVTSSLVQPAFAPAVQQANGVQTQAAAVLKMEVGGWQICEDHLGEYYCHVASGQTFDQPPQQLLQILQRAQR